ncbi:hypothetical protein D3C80_1270250 [compost metagenome]
MKHQPEDMQMDMLVRQRATDHVVSGNLENRIMEMRIRAGETRIARVAVDRRLAIAHIRRRVFKLAQRLGGHVERCEPRGLRLDQQAEGIEVFELLFRPLRSRAVTDQMLLTHKPLPLKTAQGLTDRRLGDADFAGQHIDRNTRTGRDLQGHQPMVDIVVNAIDYAARANARSRFPFRRKCHFHSPIAS